MHRVRMRLFPLLLILTIAADMWEGGDARYGEHGEAAPRRRRCYDGSLPKRPKKRDDGGRGLCPKLYPRLSCCPSRSSAFRMLHRRDAMVLSSNSTDCTKLLEELQCARCSPHAQLLYHTASPGRAPRGQPHLPILCQDYCRRLYYTCRGHIPELFQADVDEFCQYYGTEGNGLCFPDFHRRRTRGPSSNYLDLTDDYEQKEDFNRKHKGSCYCALEVAGGLRQPVGAVHCGDGSQRLFILEKEGVVRILTPSKVLIRKPFLNIHKLVQAGTKGEDERGLLSLAFHPNYKKNGKLYVSYTTNQERWAMGPHDHILRVVEYTVNRKDPNQVDMRTQRVLMEVAELHRKHLGGQLHFGADGLLHIFLGDGLITLDDMEEMDGLSDFTGAVLRVDVNTDSCRDPYAIPKDNPYFNSTNQPPEIYAHGLHSPGRCAVDQHHVNRSLLIICTDSKGKNSSTGRILQINKGEDYEHVPPLFHLPPSRAAPVGGFIYRGCQSRRLYGSYVFGDRSGNLRILQKAWSGTWREKPLCLGGEHPCGRSLVGQVLGFGEDELGEVYILTSSKTVAHSQSGKLYKVMDPKRPAAPKECQRPVEAPELLAAACSRQCRNGVCTPTGRCCCLAGWEGPFCKAAKCEPTCQNGGICIEPNTCVCRSRYSGAHCEKDDYCVINVRDGIVDQIMDVTSYLLHLTSYIV
ncbi:hedgehog-interacting protein-like isoform X1 [Brienomyrus brachyistius]|uniref:hedgehog-interacting protein-like isoform X1 n=3 Tax=Brienomyrus brachyistius TaxID=42636 RepID=UPI0020B42D82|nr:hedgehog-interacting protein-like isoform X1 [Brienomyrus brachyistius]